jgi:hypothetical protein
LTIGKGKTIGDEKAAKWQREYYEVEATIEEESALELAKGSLEQLIDTWLKGETITPKPQGNSQHPSAWVHGPSSFSMAKVPFTDAQGEHGPFQKSTAFDNLDHVALLKYLGEHKGKATLEGFFVWVFGDNKTIGRKPSKH